MPSLYYIRWLDYSYQNSIAYNTFSCLLQNNLLSLDIIYSLNNKTSAYYEISTETRMYYKI